jgi:hypothetical protein
MRNYACRLALLANRERSNNRNQEGFVRNLASHLFRYLVATRIFTFIPCPQNNNSGNGQEKQKHLEESGTTIRSDTKDAFYEINGYPPFFAAAISNKG